eukprot:jgi/Undpi1/5991/HiC_scaffold_2.g01265.m1
MLRYATLSTRTHQLESRGAHLSAGGGRGGAGLLDGGLVAGGDGGWREGGDEGERSEGWWQVAGAGEVAGEKAHEVRHVIALDEKRLRVHKQAVVGDFTETYELGKLKATKTACGSMQCRASLQKRKKLGGVVISTSTQTTDGGLHLVETRRLLGRGNVQAQVLHLGNSATGVQCLTRRTWVRVPMTELDWQEIM